MGNASVGTQETVGAGAWAVSEVRLVVTAVVLEGRGQAEVAREYGVSTGWVSKLVARYRTEGEAAFEPRFAPRAEPPSGRGGRAARR